MTRRAKIVCTLGPATATPDMVDALVDAGMDVARLNFSHGTYEHHARAYELVRHASDRFGRSVGILADLQGPKIRLGRFDQSPVLWVAGQDVTITVDDVVGSRDRISTTYARLAMDVKPGDRLLIDDGNVAVSVLDVDGNDVRCRVDEGGLVSDRKGLSLIGVSVSAPPLSDKDAADLRFALGLGVDFIALSFVRSPLDAKLVHAVMDDVGIRLPLIAKLEKPEAVADLEAVLEAFDGLMVARGDLGVEMRLEQVPLVQKRAVQLAREKAKPVIVATQMLESMITHSRPTRAEASDVANAVLDGADAVMLSGETSVGEYPIEAVRTMARILDNVESASTDVPPLRSPAGTMGGVIVKAAKDIGEALDAKALVAFTQSGDTVRRLARHHTNLPLLAFTPEPAVRSQLALTWGVETFITPPVEHTDDMVRAVDTALLSIGRLSEGDLVIIVAGSPPQTSGSTNLVRAHRIGRD
ncbi:MAG: pyruvate kinase [Geodermatophilaceae bacterium]|nr:pyruvate kinase [Geodermatophilaceae bacterium]